MLKQIIRYVVHPGWVKSQNDDQYHWIDAPRLMHLYGVRKDQCVIFDRKRRHDYPPDWVHLWPRYAGDYTLPVKE